MGENPSPLGEDFSMLAAYNQREVPIDDIISRKPYFIVFKRL